jgi:hypothetical protein
MGGGKVLITTAVNANPEALYRVLRALAGRQ